MDRYEDDFDGRSRWLKIGGGVLAGVVLLAAGFGVGRLSAPAATVGQRPTVGGSSGQTGPGPWRVENGVPVGYARTPEGAVAAATNYLTVVNGPLITQPQKYRAAINTLAAPDARTTLQDYADKTLAAFQNGTGIATYAQQGRAVVLRTSPLAYHMDRYDGTVAQVSIWAEGFIAVDGYLAVRETWATNQFTIRWTADDWRLISNLGGTEGPTPVTTQPANQSAQLPAQLKEFVTYRYEVAP